jgi:hypothetical protein
MSKDTLKNRIRISTTLTPETNNLLKDFSGKTQIPISKIIEKSVLEYIKNNGEK